MLVWNTFLTDARVTKEAETLMLQGHQVTVVAIHLQRVNLERESLPSGIEVVRVHKRPPFLLYFPVMVIRWTWPRIKKHIFRMHVPGPNENNALHAANTMHTQQRKSLWRKFWTNMGALAAMFRMFWSAWKTNADVYHAHDANTLLMGWAAARLRGKPLVYDAHEIVTDQQGYGRIRHFYGWVEKMIMPRAEGLIATTDMRADHFVDAYGCARPLVLQNRPRAANGMPEGVMRKRLNIPADRRVVIYQGGLQPGRGLMNIVRLAGRLPQYEFVLVGGGRQAGELQALAHELALENIHFPGPVPLDELLAWTVDADLGIQILRNTCLNHYTTDSNKLFEYAVAGLPVVASDFPEIRRVVESSNIGVLVDPEDLDEIEKVIRCLFEDENQYRAYRDNCLKHRHALSWEEQEERLLELYRKVTGAD